MLMYTLRYHMTGISNDFNFVAMQFHPHHEIRIFVKEYAGYNSSGKILMSFILFTK